MTWWILNTLKQSSFVLWGVFGFTYYGFNFLIISFLFFCFLSIIDTLYGYSLARANLIVSSKSRDVGVYRRVTQGFMMIGIIALGGSLSHEINNQSLQMVMSVVIFVMIAGFSFGQITSLIENMAVSAHGKELRWLNILLKIAGIGQKKIEEKVAKYTSQSN